MRNQDSSLVFRLSTTQCHTEGDDDENGLGSKTTVVTITITRNISRAYEGTVAAWGWGHSDEGEKD